MAARSGPATAQNTLAPTSQTTQAGFTFLNFGQFTTTYNGTANTAMQLRQVGRMNAAAGEINVPIDHKYGLRGEFVWKHQPLSEETITGNGAGTIVRAVELKGYSFYGEAWVWLMGDDRLIGDQQGLQPFLRYKKFGVRPIQNGLMVAARYEHIRDSKSIAMLAGNPLLLTMMAILNRNQELPRDRSDLYAQASRVLLHQWDTERALADFPGLSAEIGLREKTDILRRVASHMQAGPGGLKGNLIDGATLTGLIEGYLREELHFGQARAAARTVVDHLRLRNFILCFVGADSYAFVHRTFLEYFCAAEFVHRFNIAKTLDIDGLIALFDEHCRQDEWREVLRLICGQIDEAFVGRIVERLATRTDLEKWNEETRLPELPLAIGCLSEVRNCRGLKTLRELFSPTKWLWRVYTRVASGA